MTPPGKNLRDSFVSNLFRTPFSEKKMNGRINFCHRKKIEKKFTGGPPNHRTWPKSKKNYQKHQFAGLLTFRDMRR